MNVMKRNALALAAALTTLVASSAFAQAREAHRFHDEGTPSSSDSLRFSLVSTKAGFIRTNVDGHVRDFQLTYERDGAVVRDARIVFPVRAMSTGNGGRDEKMWGFCLDAEHHPNVEVEIRGPVPTTVQGEVLGRIKIRGQWHPIPITLSARPTRGGTVLEGSAVVSLSRLGIPDPSIWVAHVEDAVRIQLRVAIPDAPAHARATR